MAYRSHHILWKMDQIGNCAIYPKLGLTIPYLDKSGVPLIKGVPTCVYHHEIYKDLSDYEESFSSGHYKGN